MIKLAPFIFCLSFFTLSAYSKVRERVYPDKISEHKNSELAELPPSHVHWRVGGIIQEGSVIKTIPGLMINAYRKEES